jgi:hypothetical protein
MGVWHYRRRVLWHYRGVLIWLLVYYIAAIGLLALAFVPVPNTSVSVGIYLAGMLFMVLGGLASDRRFRGVWYRWSFAHYFGGASVPFVSSNAPTATFTSW